LGLSRFTKFYLTLWRSKKDTTMGIAKNSKLEARDKSKKIEQQRLPWEKDTGTPSVCTWDEIDALLVAYVVCAVGNAGGSAQFTGSRDGGALGIRVYHDDAKSRTVWGQPGEGLEDTLFAIADYYAELVGEKVRRWS